MWKYLLIFAVVLGLALFIARQDELASQQNARDAEHRSSTVTTKNDAEPSKGNIADAERHSRSWYNFFRWPNGTTTWAIILTLLAIAEQTTQTARAAKATEAAVTTADRTFALQEDTAKRQLRAYMVVKNARLFLHPDGAVEPKFELDNCGQTPAYALRGSSLTRFSSYPFESPGTPPDDVRKSTSVIGAGRQFYGLGNIINYHNMGLIGLLNHLSRPDFVCCMNGHYTYRDIFNEEHHLRFQVIVGGPAGIRQDTNEKGEAFACFCNDSEGNESD